MGLPLLYRLFCESCTGIAEYASEQKNGDAVTCVSCGNKTPRKAENYIRLSESEEKRVNSFLGNVEAKQTTKKK